MKMEHTIFALTQLGEISTVAEYLRLLDINIPTIVKKESDRIWTELDEEDETERSLGNDLEEQLSLGLTTQLLTGGTLVAIWGLYETVVSNCAKALRNKQGAGLRMRDLKGSFQESARKYFDHVLKFDLHPSGTDWNRLKTIATIRHVFAHANGSIESADDSTIEQIRQVESNSNGLEVVAFSLVISTSFANETWNFVQPLVTDLVERVDKYIRK